MTFSLSYVFIFDSIYPLTMFQDIFENCELIQPYLSAEQLLGRSDCRSAQGYVRHRATNEDRARKLVDVDDRDLNETQWESVHCQADDMDILERPVHLSGSSARVLDKSMIHFSFFSFEALTSLPIQKPVHLGPTRTSNFPPS